MSIEKKTETVETKDGHKIDVKNYNLKGDVFSDKVFEQIKDDYREMSLSEAISDIKVPIEEYREKFGEVYKKSELND